MASVFLLQHSYEIYKDYDEIKTLGIYSTKEKAEEAIERYKILSGFQDHPDDFYISEYKLDIDAQWMEGFFTYRYYEINTEEVFEKIKEIVYSVPDGLYRYPMPDCSWEDEWLQATPNEKGFLLIQEIFDSELNKEHQGKMKKVQNPNTKVLHLGQGPTFWTQADEEMFFKAIYSMASFLEVKGQGTELDLFYKEPMTIEEKRFLIGLLKRYQMDVPEELNIPLEKA